MNKKARAPSPRSDAKRHGLRYVTVDRLTIRRRRQGSGFCYLAPDGRVIRDNRMRQRLQRLAVPPAYEDVLYANDPDAHIQAIGRDAAGRLQYRYHARWQGVREAGKARRLAHLAEAMPRIRRTLAQASRIGRSRTPVRLVRRDRPGDAQRDPARSRELRPDERDARRRDPAQVEHRAWTATRCGSNSAPRAARMCARRCVRRDSPPRSRHCGNSPDGASSSIATRAASCAGSRRSRSTHSCVRSPARRSR